MRVGFKRVLLGLGVVAAIALGGLAVFLLTFDPNAYKDKFEQMVYERYQRTLSMDGDIELSLFPRIGLSVRNISLSNRDSDITFASVDSARFAVAIWPLLSNRFVVDHVAVTGLKAWVRRDEQGHFNFDDLLGGSPPPAEPAATAPGAAAPGAAAPAAAPQDDAAVQIDIAGLELKGGEIHYSDAITGNVARMVKLQLNTGRMTFGQPFDVSLRGTLLGEQPQADATLELQAQVKMDPLAKTYSAQRLSIQMAGRLEDLQARSAVVRGSFVYNGYSRMLDANGVELALQGGLQGASPVQNLEASLSLPRLKIDRGRAEFNMEKLALRAKGNLPKQAFELAFDAPQLSISPLQAKGEAIQGSFKLDGDKTLGLKLRAAGLGGDAWNLTLKEAKVESQYKDGPRLVRVNLSTPMQWDVSNEKGALSAIKGDVKVDDPGLPGGSFEFPFIGSLHTDLVKSELSSDINAVLNGAPLNFNLKATQLSDPKLRFALQADALDLDKLFPPAPPPKEAAPAQPAAQAAPPAQAAPAQPAATPAPAAAAPAPAADAKTVAAPKPDAKADAKPDTKPDAKADAKAAAAAPQPLNLAWLDGLDAEGTVKIGKLGVRTLAAEQFGLSLVAHDGKLEINDLAAQLYGGTLAGKLSVDSANRYTAKVNLKHVAVQPLLKVAMGQDRLEGTGDMALDVRTQGATPEAMTAGLSGSAQVHLNDGKIKGIDLSQTLGRVADLLRAVLQGGTLDLGGTFDPGSATGFKSFDTDLALSNGIGEFRKLSLDAPALRVERGKPARVDLVHKQVDLVANVQVLRSNVVAELASLRGVTVPVHVSGPLDAPSYQIVWQGINGKVIENAVRSGLESLLGGGQSKSQTAPTTGGGAAGAAKDLGNALKGLLGR